MRTEETLLPDDITSLKKIINEKDAVITDRDAVIVNLKTEYENKLTSSEKNLRLLREELEYFKAQLFARKSERWTEVDLQQRLTFDEAADTGEDPAPPVEIVRVRGHERRRKKGGRRPLPESLPRREIHHKLEGKDRIHGCGQKMKTIGEEVSEKLVVVPPRMYVERHIREKVACPCEGVDTEGKEGAVRIAPLPPQIIPQGIATPGLLAYLLTGKFADHLPFYRQERIFERIGVDLPRQTMCNWALKVYAKARPLLELMDREILGGDVLGLDDTTVQVMGEEGREDTAKSSMWVALGGPPDKPVLMYHYNMTRSGKFVNKYLREYSGYLQCDGHKNYDQVGKRPDVTLVGCMAHARRRFVKAAELSKNSHSARAAVSTIRKLYMIEREARESGLSYEQTRDLRQEKAKPILDGFKEWLDKRVLEVIPKSLLGKAIHYTLNQWPRLIVYLEDGRIRIDNNLVENAIRPFVLGRKNWIFSGSPRGADASAGIYSLIETAKANKLEPYWYLLYLFKKLPYAKTEDDYRALLPSNVPRDKVKLPTLDDSS